MSLPLYIALVVANFFGLLAIFFSLREDKKQQKIQGLSKIVGAGVEAVAELENVAVNERSKLLALLSSLPDGVFMIDRAQHLITINHTAKQFLAIQSPTPTVGDVLTNLPEILHFEEKIEQAITYNHIVEEKDVLLHGRSLAISIRPFLDLADTSGHVRGVVVYLRDISHEKKVMLMKEDFTGIIMHELRTPLTSIRASAALLRTRPHLTEEERQRLLKVIEEQTGKLLSEVQIILDAAKLQSGLFMIHTIPGNLQELLAEITTIYAPKAQERFITLLQAIDPTLPAFSFDPDYLKLAVSNLIENSLKFTPVGGTIKLSAKYTSGKILISISDTGSGIPKNKQHLLFSKFSQIHPPGSQVGTGIGLYLVKGIVLAHGGTIGFESEEGAGTTISFTLPVAAIVKPLTHPTPAPTKPHTLVN